MSCNRLGQIIAIDSCLDKVLTVRTEGKQWRRSKTIDLQQQETALQNEGQGFFIPPIITTAVFIRTQPRLMLLGQVLMPQTSGLSSHNWLQYLTAAAQEGKLNLVFSSELGSKD